MSVADAKATVAQLTSWFKDKDAAKNYEFGVRMTGPPGEALLKQCDLSQLVQGSGRPKLLDNAAGTAIITRYIQEQFPDKFEITCGDFSESMIGSLKEDISNRGWTNVKAVVADAQDTQLPSDEFDAVITSFAVMALPKPFDALKECLRVAKPGGIIGFTTWNHIGWYPDVITAIKRVEGCPALPDPKAFWQKTGQWHDVEWVAAELQKLGFQDVNVQIFDKKTTFPEGVQFYVSGLKNFLINLMGVWPQEVRDNKIPLVLEELEKVIEERCGKVPEIGMVAVLASGKKAQ